MHFNLALYFLFAGLVELGDRSRPGSFSRIYSVPKAEEEIILRQAGGRAAFQGVAHHAIA